MDEAQNNYMNIDDQDLYSSTLPWDNEFEFAEEIDLSKVFYFGEEKADNQPNIFDFGEEEDLSKIFDYPKEQSANTNIIPSISVENSSPNHLRNFEIVSELPNIIPKEKQPMVTINCPTYSSVDKNSSRITHQINHDDDDDYSLSYIYSMGLNNTMLQDGGGTTSDWINQESSEIFIPIPIVVGKDGETSNSSRKKEQENPNTNDMILQQPLPKIPVLEKFERESSLNNPHGISTSMRAKEQENPKTNSTILQRSMPHILTLEKLESQLMLGNDSYGILSSLDNECQQKRSVNGGPIRRSPNRTSSRYQPFGREIDPNNHGSDRVRQSNSESIFTGSQISGIASDYASSSLHGYMLLNNIQGKSDFSQVAEIGKQNGHNEEAFFGRSSNPVNYPNNNFQHSHQITDGAPDLLQSSWAQGWNAHDSHFNTTTNWPTGPFH